MPSTFLAVELACDGPCRFRVPENAHIQDPIINILHPVPATCLADALGALQDIIGPSESWESVNRGWLSRVSVGIVLFHPNPPELRAIVRDACGFWWGVFEREINNEPA